jgi:hypothetical protein
VLISYARRVAFAGAHGTSTKVIRIVEDVDMRRGRLFNQVELIEKQQGIVGGCV